jgi:rhodanese-related sulfurtransferase
MLLTLAVVGIVGVVACGISLIVRMKRQREERDMEQHSITADQLHALLASDPEVLVFDVRQPLDLLAYPEVIPKAQRVAPSEVLANPRLIPNDKESVVYCTCPSDKTSRMVLRRALALGISRIKFLEGGLAAWKAKGYPVVPYKGVFRLNPTLVPRPQ